MSVVDAFRYCFVLMVKKPSIILPSLIIIFLVSIVIHSLIVTSFGMLSIRDVYFAFGSLSLLIDLGISVVVGIFLSGYYVGLVDSQMRGRLSFSYAMKDLNTNKGKLGWIGSAILGFYALLIGGVLLAYYCGVHYFGVGSVAYYALLLLALALVGVYLYFSVLFYEINLVLMVEKLSGIHALRRSAAMAKHGNMLAILIAVVVVGVLYLLIFFAFGAWIQGLHGYLHQALTYLSIIPDAIVTTIFDIMPPAMYYRHVMKKRKRWAR